MHKLYERERERERERGFLFDVDKLVMPCRERVEVLRLDLLVFSWVFVCMPRK